MRDDQIEFFRPSRRIRPVIEPTRLLNVQNRLSRAGKTDEANLTSLTTVVDGIGTTLTVTQAGHGFTPGTAVYFTGNAWAKAQSNAIGTLGIGVVTTVSDPNTFIITFVGYVTQAELGGLALSVGNYYFVSDATAGVLTGTEPTSTSSYSNPVLFAITNSTAVILPFRPSGISGAAAGAPAVSNLSDVALSTLLEAQVLQYDIAAAKWENKLRGPRIDKLWAYTGLSGGNQVTNSTVSAGFGMGANAVSSSGTFTNIWANGTDTVMAQMSHASGSSGTQVYLALDGQQASSSPLCCFGQKPMFQTRVIANGGTTNVRYYVGVISSNGTISALKSSNPSGFKTAAFRWDASVDTTNWKAVYSDGTNITVVDTGVALNQSTSKLFEVAWDGTNLRYYIDSLLVATITPTSAPSAPVTTDPWIPIVYTDNAINASTVATSFQCGGLYMEAY